MKRRPPLQKRRVWLRVRLARWIAPDGYGVCVTGKRNAGWRNFDTYDFGDTE